MYETTSRIIQEGIIHIFKYLATLCLCLTMSSCSLRSRGCTCAASFNTLSTASCEVNYVYMEKKLGMPTLTSLVSM